MEASPGGPDVGDLAGKGLGRCREGTGFIGDLARVLPPPHPVFPANSGSKRYGPGRRTGWYGPRRRTCVFPSVSVRAAPRMKAHASVCWRLQE